MKSENDIKYVTCYHKIWVKMSVSISPTYPNNLLDLSRLVVVTSYSYPSFLAPPNFSYTYSVNVNWNSLQNWHFSFLNKNRSVTYWLKFRIELHSHPFHPFPKWKNMYINDCNFFKIEIMAVWHRESMWKKRQDSL